VANRIASSPITLTSDPASWRSIPEVPIAVQDGFGPKATVMLHRGRWRGLIPREGEQVFAWFDGASRRVEATALRTRVSFGQTLESDARGRALVIGGAGESLYAVGPEGAASCLGVLGEGKISTACWLGEGGVALVIGAEVCVYSPGPERLRPRLRFRAPMPEVWGLRELSSPGAAVSVLALMGDHNAALYAIGDDDEVRALADFDGLELADVRIFLDETGYRMMLGEGATLSVDANPIEAEGLAAALDLLALLPLVDHDEELAELGPGPDLARSSASEAKVEFTIAPLADAGFAPPLERLGRLTAALIRMLRAAPQRSASDLEILHWIREGMAADLRAYLHAWALHAPNNPAVYEFWMQRPELETREFIREHAGEAVKLGIFASGEPIVARIAGVGSCEVVMIDEEGVPYRYRGLEGFLADLQQRSDGEFELDAWMD